LDGYLSIIIEFFLKSSSAISIYSGVKKIKLYAKTLPPNEFVHLEASRPLLGVILRLVPSDRVNIKGPGTFFLPLYSSQQKDSISFQ
jgi:hypothetical protein